MRVLHTVESYLPARHGMAEAVRQISERLVRRGHDVTVATRRDPERNGTSIDGVHVEAFDVTGNEATGIAGETDRYQRYLREGHFDVVANFAAQQWATDLAFPVLHEIPARKVFVPTGFSGLYLPEFRDYFSAMADRMRRYDVNVFLSETYRDAAFAREHGVENRVLIPNGAAADEFLAEPALDIRSKLGIDPGHLLVLHVGDHSGSKGHREAVEIFAEARLPDAALVLVSARLASAPRRRIGLRRSRDRSVAGVQAAIRRARRRRIVLAPLSRPETVAAFRAADVFLFPSNIECSPIVLFEALAAGTPFLSTDAGNAAEIVAWSGGGDILPTRPLAGVPGWVEADIEGSAAMLRELGVDPDRRASMAEAGHAAWRERFTWELVAEQYERLYLDLTAR